MSRLAVGSDDHPQAALKHLDDARVLLAAGRHDSVAYHAGYAVECSFKTVVLHDRSYQPATNTTDPVQLVTWHKKLSSKSYGHNLANLVNASLGPEGARYAPPIDLHASVFQWSETLRYTASGTVQAHQAEAYLAWAELAIDSVVRMTLDGVLT